MIVFDSRQKIIGTRNNDARKKRIAAAVIGDMYSITNLAILKLVPQNIAVKVTRSSAIFFCIIYLKIFEACYKHSCGFYFTTVGRFNPCRVARKWRGGILLPYP